MEPQIPPNLIDRVVSVAENMADELIRSDGRVVQLEEDQDLQLPFLLPEDGYSCDTIKGVPNGLGEYVEPITRAGLCRMMLQPQASGLWTVYMSDDESSQIIEVRKCNCRRAKHDRSRWQIAVFLFSLVNLGLQLHKIRLDIGLDARKPVFGGLRITQLQTSLPIRAVWSAPLLFAFWKVSYLNLLWAKISLF